VAVLDIDRAARQDHRGLPVAAGDRKQRAAIDHAHVTGGHRKGAPLVPHIERTFALQAHCAIEQRGAHGYRAARRQPHPAAIGQGKAGHAIGRRGQALLVHIHGPGGHGGKASTGTG
jgi:hypothetical protein